VLCRNSSMQGCSIIFHRYLMVGGMPDAVNTFLATNNIDSVRTVQLGPA
jgi:hypothetical protein